MSRALTFTLNIAIARTVDRRIPLLPPPPSSFLTLISLPISLPLSHYHLSPHLTNITAHPLPIPHRKPPHTQRCQFSFVKHYLNCRESLGRGAVQLQLITDAILTLSREGFRDAMQRTPASDWNASPSRERLLRVAWLSVPLSALVAVAVIMSGSASGALEAQGAAAAALLFALAALVEMVLLPYMLQGLGFGDLEFGFFLSGGFRLFGLGVCSLGTAKDGDFFFSSFLLPSSFFSSVHGCLLACFSSFLPSFLFPAPLTPPPPLLPHPARRAPLHHGS